jgi:ribonucleoside-triphosphate reductase
LKEKSLMLGWLKCWPYKKKFGELQEEMKMINKVLIEVYTEWDHAGSVFTFPIPTYNIVEDFPWDDPLVDDMFEMTAKYWLPYFQNFIGSQFEKDENGRITTRRKEWAYSPSAVRSMCCRLQLDLKQLEKRWGWLFGSSEMTWSIWVVTINAARIW